MSKIRYCLCGILLFLSILFLSVTDLNATQVFNFSYTGDYQEFVAPENGYYKFEAWGAGGGKNRAQGGFTDSCARLPGYGAYTSGITYLAKGQKVYVYVGGRGSDAEVNKVVPGGWNGGGTGDYDHADNEAAGAGGGATDFRLRNGNWDDFDSLKSRVMVAGAGGGSAYELAGGYGGVLTGGSTKYSQGGGQDSGYAFGKGMDGVFVDNNIDVAGGGSGYYGGFANSNGGAGGYETSGAGGSSFVSGCTGCNAISEYATKDKIRHTGSNIHYSKLTFSNIIMTAGNASMPKYSGTGTMTGNAENGYARITKLDNSEVITNITVDESYGVLVKKTYDYSPYEYTIYLKPNQIITGDLNLEILGSPLSITGYQNIKMQSGTKINITMTKSTGEVQVYTVNFDVQKAHLKSLSFDYMKIDDFKPLRYEYSGSVTYGVKNLNYFITVNDGATYEVVGNNNLKYGENEIIITVHEDGLEAGIYKVKVVREEFQEDRKTLNSIDFEYTGSEQEYTVPKTGEYILEVWGAEGGYRTTESYAGKGGYSVGTVKLKAGTKLYIYVGGAGGHGSSGCGTTICPGGFNGGGYRYKYYGGGGASDIRFVGGSWNNSNSLLSRLIVAGGGGSDGAANKYGMFGGGESGGSTTQSCSGCGSYCGQGGKQTYSGYSSAYTATTQATTGLNSNNAAYYKGGFGFGGGGIYLSNGYGGAGGGGWYGGSGNAPDGSGDDDRGGGGGSGFIWTESTKDNVPTGYSVSSSYYLSDASTISGDKAIPSYTDNTTMVGNAGDGHVRITRINGAPILIDLNIENAKLLEPIDYERNDYRLEIPNDNFETNVSVTTDIESYIIGDKTVTFKEGEVHHIILMSLDGQITVINITPVINQPVLDNISFDEVDFDFFPNIINYEFSVPSSVTSLTPHIDKKDEITYEIVGLDNLKVGNNKFKIIAKNQANKTVEYNFNVKRELEALSQNLEYTGDYQTFTASKDGYYKIEAWGASGGKNMADGVYANSYIREGGNGAYVSGTIYLNAGEKLYVYIGGKGTDGYQKTIVSGGWNGGGRGDWDHGDDEAAGAGGGATDIRLVSGEWNDFESLKSRIMVAAGGGGAAYNHTGGAGGNTVSDNTLHSTGANQTSGYQFGVGQDGVYSTTNIDIAGAGGGYYGGRTGYVSGRGSYQAAGTGGSSFVSGCTGCDAISESSTSSNIIHTGQSKHYSNKVFSGIQMFKGTEEMPDYESDGKITGNASNGHVRITYKSDSEPVTDLDSLTVTPGTLTPSFTKGVYEYDVSIDDIDTKVVVDASVNNDNVLITGLGEIEIPVGSFTHQVTMADEIGNVTIYELNFNRQQNNYKFLKDILVNGISIPNFNPQVYEYDVTTPYDLDIVNVEGVKHSEGQRVQDDGVFNLDNDTLSVVIFVISEDGTENQTYTVNIKREKTSKLKSLNSTTLGIGVKFEHNKSEYELEIPKNIYEMEFTAVPFYKSAKVSITGNNYIEDGTVIHVVSHVDGVEDSIYDIKIKVALDAVSSYEKEFKYIGKTETFVVPYTGNYEIKLWGAAGGIGMNNGSLNKEPGEGAYTSGKIYLQAGTTLYVNIGGQGTNAATIDKFTGGAGGYNGGGKGGNDSNRDSQPEPAGGGGGASDIRLVDGLWNDAASLRSRLMVASGAAGGSYGAVGVPAGGLEGYKPSNSNSIATQVKGYALGVGQDGYNASAGSSGAGGGYYGGYNISGGYYSGGSGSSYISGHPGSVGTKEDGKPVSSSYTKIEDSYNYSGKYFTETQMIDGAGYLWTTVKDRLELMPSPSGGYFDSGRGNPGNGSGSIKLLSVLSSNNFLDSITLNDGDIELNFEPWVLEYDVYLLEDETSLKVDATPKDMDALIDGTGTHKIKPFDSVIPITVTATDGSIRVYNINVYREPDTDPTPNEIKVNKMTPYICNIDSSYCQYTFDKDTVLYNITVPFAINKIELLAVPKSEWQNVIYRKYNGTQYVEVENGNVDLSSGLNSFEVEVVSEDEVSSTIYTYNITRDPRGNTNVLDIKVENPTVAITYEPLVYEYSINLGAEYSSVDFLVKPELSGATVHMKSDKIFGQIQDDGYIKVTANNLGQGMNDAYIVVTALNGETKTYIFHIYKEQDTNVFLTNIEVSSGGVKYELSPKFDKLVNNYVVEVPNTVSSVDIKATSESSSTTINIDNPGNLTSGMNEATISVSNGDASANVYKISIVKAKGSNPNLLNIEAVGYTLDETFDKNTTEYHLTVPKDVKKLVLKVTPEESTTTYTIRGNNNLINNMNTITITSIAENKVKKVYYLYVSKDISNNNNLSDILVSDGTLSPAFDKDTLNYNVTVDENIDRITVNGILEDVNARIVGNGEHALITGDNVIKLVVSSELGDEKTYTITVHRNESDDTTLLKVENDQNSEVIKINENSYLIDVQNEVKRINIKGYPTSSKATVSGNGYYDLVTGNNDITLMVTSESGSVGVYTVTVVRDLSKNDDLSYLFAPEGALYPTFKDTTIYYDMYVDNDVTSLNLEAIPEDNKASVKIIGNENFEVGENLVTVRVTAESGNIKEYVINVIRQEGNTDDLLLSDMSIVNQTISPDFSSYTYVYYLTVPNEVNSVMLTGEAANQNHKVIGIGNYDLRVGKNAIGLLVKNDEGLVKSYQVVVTREKSSDATLSSLVVKGHTLSPAFNKNTTSYNLNTSLTELEFTTILPTESESTYVVSGNENFVSGENTVTISVTAPDGVTVMDYVITVNRSKSKNNNLASLEVLGHTLVPTFHKGVLVYAVDVPSDVNSVIVNATAEDKTATVSGTGVVKLDAGVNEVNVVVTSESNTTKTYLVIITREASDNNYLSSLFVSEGNLDPTFDKETSEYNVVVSNEIDEIGISGEVEVNSSSIKGFGTFPLNVGLNSFTVSVTSESGLIRNYVINVTREELISAKLKSLVVTDYDLDTPFDSDYFEYYINVPNEVFDVDINATPVDSNANVVISGNSNFVVGMNEVTITVTSRDGLKEEVYTLYVNRQLSTNNKLLYLTTDRGELTPVFNPDTLSYTLNVDKNIEDITINAEVEDSSARIVSGTGKHLLVSGDNKIQVKVRSILGVERTYTINVNRAKSSNNNLNMLRVYDGTKILYISPTFDKDILSYDLDVSSSVKFVRLEALVQDSLASVTGDGTKSLVTGQNSYEIVVTAEDGSKKTYTVNINRTINTNNKVIDIIPSVGDYTAKFNPDIHEYTLNVNETDLFLSFEVETESDYVSVSGHEKQAIAAGNSVRVITITAEDNSVNTYKINVVKNDASNALLESLTIDGYEFEFDPNTFTYNIQVSRSKKTLLESEITAVPKDSEATVNMMGDLNLVNGMVNIYVVEIIAKDGYTTQEYKLNVTRDSLDYTLRSDVYKIVRSDEETYTEDGKTYTVIDEDYVIGIEPDTNSETFINNFLNEDKSMLHVYDLGEVMISEGNVGTSYKIKLESEDYVYDELVVIVRGDLTKDGKVNITDQAQMISYIGKVITFDKYQTLAADITKDGKVNITDQAQIISYIGKVIKDIN